MRSVGTNALLAAIGAMAVAFVATGCGGPRADARGPASADAASGAADVASPADATAAADAATRDAGVRDDGSLVTDSRATPADARRTDGTWPHPDGPRDAGTADGLPLTPDGPSPYGIDLGGGPAPFRHLTSGDSVPWVHGPQGLPMIILAVRARGFAPSPNPTQPAPDDPLLATSCTNVMTGQEVGAGRQRQGLAMQPDGWAEFYDGWTPFVAPMPTWLGQRLRCTATLSDGAGHMASDVREVVVNVVEGQ